MLNSIRLRIRALLKRRQLDRDLSDELAHHMEMRNASPRAPFGNRTAIQEEIRDLWSFTAIENLWRDVRHAVRVLLRAPGHTTAIVLLLAIGIGANAAIFTLFNAVFIQPLAVDRPQELAILTRTVKGTPSLWSGPGLEEFRSRQTSFSALIAMTTTGYPMLSPTDLGDQQSSNAFAVTGNFFQVLGVRAAIGRVFTEAEDQPGNPNFVVVLSDSYWRHYLGSDPAVVGRTLIIRRRQFEVIGVTPPEFVGLGESVWAPLHAVAIAELSLRDLIRGPQTWATVIGRLKPGVSIQQAQAEAEVAFAHTRSNAPEDPALTSTVRVEPGSRGFRRVEKQYGASLQVLMGAVGLLLLIACANVGSLLLARAGSRQREIAVRLALGCGRKRLVRQFLVESVVLAAAGCALGLVLASWTARGLMVSALAGGFLPVNVSLDANVLLFTLAASGVAAIMFGLAPALRASSIGIEPALKSASQTTTGPRSRQLLNRCFVATQVALSVVLVAGAAMFGQSLYRLHSTAGFDGQNVVTTILDGGAVGSFDANRYVSLAQTLTERFSKVPHVKSVSVASRWNFNASIEGAPENWGPPHVDTVSANFLETLGIPIVAGRGFNANDRKGAPAVSVVNETFARVYFHGENPIGKYFTAKDNASPIAVVGIMRDSKFMGFRSVADPVAYVTFEQFPTWVYELDIRVDGSVQAVLPILHSVLTEVIPKQRSFPLGTLEDRLNRMIPRDIWLARITGLFGALAMGLACFGVYGVISYLVVTKTTEIGIRLAVGARPRQVLREVIVSALTTVAPGVVLGIGIAIGTERLIASLLFGFKSHDPVTYGAVTAGLLLTTVLAAYLPARRASKIDPVNALRCE